MAAGDGPPVTIARSLAEREVCAALRSVEDLRDFRAEQPWLFHQAHVAAMIQHIRENGATFLGRRFPPRAVRFPEGTNYRESLIIENMNSRQRCVLELFNTWDKSKDPRISVYAPEAITAFALHMRGRYPKYLGSEYTSDETVQRRLFPIIIQDIQRLTFQDESFDAFLSNDVLEHIPNIRLALKEIARILKPDGLFLSCFPFSFRRDTTVRATLENGHVKHYLEPQYHGNPVEPKRGSLVFTIPGFDILDMALEAGFTGAHMVYFSSARRALVGGAANAGIMVMRCRKAP